MNKMILLGSLCLSTIFYSAMAQTISTPPGGDNQQCQVTQHIGGIAKVTVRYNSPDVTSPTGEDRTGKIWGQLVPYGLTDLGFGKGNPAPWRAGANENTVISFSHDVKIGGMDLNAGDYGLHLIARENGPWTWIFSRNTAQWGSYFYDETEDALRVDVQPKDGEHTEWLTYDFIDRKPTTAVLALKWERKLIPMEIEVKDYNDLYVNTFRNELQGAAGFNYQNWVAASQFCLNHETHLDQGLEWAEAAINAPFVGVRNFSTLQNKSGILLKMGRETEAEEAMMMAIKDPSATAFQIHQLGRQLITMGRKEKAMEIFEYNHDHFDGAWPTNVGMARGLSAMGRFSEALKYAEMAYEEAPDQLNKDGMKAAVEKLKMQQDFN
jgi:tetratricopeptide (TPR) repeat protein